MSPCSRSVLITFTVRVTKRHPVNISFLKRLVQSNIEAQSILPCSNRNKTSVPMFYQNKISVLVWVRVINLIHTHPNSYLYFILRLNTGTDVLFFKYWVNCVESTLTSNATKHDLCWQVKQVIVQLSSWQNIVASEVVLALWGKNRDWYLLSYSLRTKSGHLWHYIYHTG